MRLLAVVAGLLVLVVAGPARAQACPGADGWVFDDVSASDPFCPFVTYMATSGVTTGCQVIDAGRRLFCPESALTRKQMAAFMSRLASGAVFAEGGNAFGTTAVLGTLDNQPLDVRVNGVRAFRLEPRAQSPALVGGHPANTVGPDGGQVVAGGGYFSTTCYEQSTGTFTRSCTNRTLSSFSAVSGGASNAATATTASVSGGFGNTASGVDSTVAGGAFNRATGQSAIVAGGTENTASGHFAFVAGGLHNAALASYTFAGGRRAKATTTGSFIWADSRNFDFQPSVDNFFGVRATGGVGLTVAIDPSTGGVTQFCNYLPGYSGWSCTSDRNAKENLEQVNGGAVLERLAAMPVYTFNFKGADPSLRMLGPTAQDFHAAFGLGEETTTIASGNLHGVALAAIQGLQAQLLEREAALRVELRAKDDELAALRDRVTELARAVEALTAGRTDPRLATR